MTPPNVDDSLDLFRLVVDQAPDAIIFADLEGIIRLWNMAAADLLGYSSAEAIGRSLDVIIPEHLRRAHWEGFRRAVASGRTRHERQAIKTRATHKSGERVYLSLAFSVVKNQQGGVLGGMATARAFSDTP